METLCCMPISYTCNKHNIVHQLYFNWKKKKKKKDPKILDLYGRNPWVTSLEKSYLNSTDFLVVVQSPCRVWLFVTPWTAAHQASLSFWSLLKLMSIELAMQSIHLISVTLFSSCSQYFWASGSFPMSWLFASGGQSIGASASASVLPVTLPQLYHDDRSEGSLSLRLLVGHMW